MKHFSIAFASLCTFSTFRFVSAQNVTQMELEALEQVLPSCSAQCLVTLAPQYNCSPLDTSCTCGNSRFATVYVACMSETCTVKQILSTVKLGAESCGYPVRDKGPRIRAACWSLFSISVLAIALRFCARSPALDGPGYGWDDWIMLAVLAFAVPQEAGQDLMVQNGLGQDTWMLAPDWNKLTFFFFLLWLGDMLYTCVTNLTKIAILLLYLRIFPNVVANWFRVTCFSIIGILGAGTIGMVLSIAFQCTPVGGAWESWHGEYNAKCINSKLQFLGMDGVAIFFDILIFTLPIPKIIKLQASWRKRLGISLVFLVGLFVTVSRIVRITKLVQINNRSNGTWELATISLWVQAEVNMGIVCACMPSYPRLVRIVWKKTTNSLYSKSGGSSGSGRPQISWPGGSQVAAQSPVISAPVRGLTKTVETTVYSRNVNSCDEMELMDRSPSTVTDDGYHYQSHQHPYARQW